MHFVSWLYLSVSSMPRDLAGAEIKAIVSHARRRNAAVSLSGALIYTGARFVQYVEGPPDAVYDLKDRVGRDTRHHAIQTVMEEPVDRRLFDQWSLAFVGTSHSVNATINRSLRAHTSGLVDGATELRDLLWRLSSSPEATLDPEDIDQHHKLGWIPPAEDSDFRGDESRRAPRSAFSLARTGGFTRS